MQHGVAEWIAGSGQTLTAIARRAGVDRSTLHRIVSGAVSPTLSTLREIAFACGLEAEVTASPSSDPTAAAAARQLLDAEAPASREPAVAAWERRLARMAGDDPIRIVVEAGRSASLLHRRNAIALSGPRSVTRLASAGAAGADEWAISGAAPLELAVDSPVDAPHILWVSDPERAAQLLADTHRRAAHVAYADVIVAAHDASVLDGLWELDAITYVAPLQFVLDGVGLGGAAQDAALAIARGWSS